MTTITLRDLRRWLGPFDDDAPCGQARNGDSCPVACYLKAQGYDDVSVGADEIYAYGASDTGYLDPSAGVTRLIDTLDAAHVQDEPVTADYLDRTIRSLLALGYE